MEAASGQLHVIAVLPPGSGSPVPLTGRPGGPQRPSGLIEIERNVLQLPKMGLRLVGYPASSQLGLNFNFRIQCMKYPWNQSRSETSIFCHLKSVTITGRI